MLASARLMSIAKLLPVTALPVDVFERRSVITVEWALQQ